MSDTAAPVRPHHVNFVVSDLDRSIPFYRDTLGFKLVQDAVRENLPSYDAMLGHPGIRLRVALFALPGSDLLLELFQFFEPAPIRQHVGYHAIGSAHVAFECRNIDALHLRLTSQGAASIAPPTDVVRDARLLARAFYLKDPDGIIIEMFEPNEAGREHIPGCKP